MNAAPRDTSVPAKARSLRACLLRYRVMAYVTAVLLIILVFVGVPLQVAAGNTKVVNVVGTLHGFLYIVYLFAAFDLSRRIGLGLWRMVLVLLAGTIPFCAIVAERLLTGMIERDQVPAQARGTGLAEGGR